MRKNNIFFTTIIVLSLLIISMLYMLLYPRENTPYAISVIVVNSNDSMWKRFEAGMRQASLNDNVNINVINTSEMETLADQENMILTELKNGTDGIITQFIDSTNTKRIVSEIVEKSNLELLLNDVDVNDSDKASISEVKLDDALVATTLTSQIFDDIGRNLSFKRVCIIAGNQNQKNLQLRLKTVTEILEKEGASITQVLQGNSEQLSTQLKYIDKPSFLVALDSISLDSTISYAQENNVPLYGIGCSDKSVNAMDNGIIRSMVVPDAYMIGYRAIHEMYKNLHLNRKKFDSTVDYYVVNRDNMFTTRNEKILFPIGD